jgi:hypothetical protein
VDWFVDHARLYIDWYSGDNAHDDLRSRAVVA